MDKSLLGRKGLKMVSSLYCTLMRVCLHFFVLFYVHETSQNVNIFQLLDENVKFQNNCHNGYKAVMVHSFLYHNFAAAKINEAVGKKFERLRR